jgi:hypothetical protein
MMLPFETFPTATSVESLGFRDDPSLTTLCHRHATCCFMAGQESLLSRVEFIHRAVDNFIIS